MSWSEIRDNLARSWNVQPDKVSDEDVLAFKNSGSGIPIGHARSKIQKKEPTIPRIFSTGRKVSTKTRLHDESDPAYEGIHTQSEK